MSGGEPSSIKRSPGCATRTPVLSREQGDRVGVTFDFGVYGLVLQSGTLFLKQAFGAGGEKRASGILQKMETADL